MYYNYLHWMSEVLQKGDDKLEETLKLTLQQCIMLARKKIRSKKGLTELQALLTDYRSNSQLAVIIYQVVKLITLYESAKKDESDQIKDTVPIEEYTNLEIILQKYQSSVREHIRNQQQLKIYCEDLEEKNRELEKNNEELLKNTKQIITNLKRDNQRLIEENGKLREKAKENEKKERETPTREREESIINSIKKARKLIDSQNSHTGRQQGVQPWGDRGEDSLKLKRHSLSSIKQNK